MIHAADKVLKQCEHALSEGDADSVRKLAKGLAILTGNPAWEQAYLFILEKKNTLGEVSVTLPNFPYGSEPESIAPLLHKLHDEKGQQFPNQSVRGGTQVNLTKGPHYVRDFLDEIGVGNTIGIWTTRLQKGGHHIPHIHPNGGRSHVLYIDVPDINSGHLFFGVSRYSREEPTHFVIPNPGTMASFPNWLWHGVTRYMGEKPRLAIAWDTDG